MKIACAALTLQTYWRLLVQREKGTGADFAEPDIRGFVRMFDWASGLGFHSLESWIPNEKYLASFDLASLKAACLRDDLSVDYLACDFMADWFERSSEYVQKYAEKLGSFVEASGTGTIGTVSPLLPSALSKPSRVYPGAPPDSVKLLPGFSWQKSWSRYVGMLRTVTRELNEHSLRLAIEPRPREMASSTDAILRLIEAVPAENLGGLLYTSHLQTVGESPPISIHKLGKKLYEFHASENDGVTSYHWAPGQGELDWPEIIATLRGVGYGGAVCVDVTGVNVEEEALEGEKFLRSLMKRLRVTSAT